MPEKDDTAEIDASKVEMPVVDSVDEWLATLVSALGLPATYAVDRALVLDLARDAAHGVARPAAPLTTFLIGLAAGMAGGSISDVERAAAAATRALEPS